MEGLPPKPGCAVPMAWPWTWRGPGGYDLPARLVSDIEGQPLLLRNVSPERDHWLTLRLDGARVIEGASVTLRAGAQRWVRRATTGGSYLSASDPRVHAGLGETGALDTVEVRWPAGVTTMLRNVPVDREVAVRGEGGDRGDRHP
jgi:enediyne biosynthesis protein E4